MFTKEKAQKICDERGISLPQHRSLFAEGYSSGYVDGWLDALSTFGEVFGKRQPGSPSIPDAETR